MATYEYGRIQKLADSLAKAAIAPEIIAQVMAGGEEIKKDTSPEKKADWLRGAMRRLDALVDRPIRLAIREACACCLSGKRGEVSRAIAKEHATLDERVRAANEAKLVFGHGVSLTDDGKVLVEFAPEGLPEYRCACLPKAREPLSITYCYCCGGHVKHHLQTVLGRRLDVTVRSSALSSGGRRPCSFLFDFSD